MAMHRPIAMAALLALAACTGGPALDAGAARTPAPTMRFGGFRAATLRGLNPADFKDLDTEVPQQVNSELRACMARVFPGLTGAAFADAIPPGTLVIEPRLLGARNIAKPGPFQANNFGASQVLLQVLFVDGATGRTVADPVFYDDANYLARGYSFGLGTFHMLDVVAKKACDYAEANR